MSFYSSEAIELVKSVESSPRVYKGIFDKNEVSNLIQIEENYTQKRLVDRDDSRKTKLDWQSETRKMITDKIENLFPNQIRNGDLTAHFIKSRFPLRIHADMGRDPSLIPYKNILIPLYVRGAPTTYTVLFKQKWYGESSLFSKDSDISSGDYFFKDANGKFVYIKDANELLTQLKFNLNKVVNFCGGEFFASEDTIGEIEALLKQARYSKRTNKHITNNVPFNKNHYEKYLSHQPYEDLQGLEIDRIIEWHPGDVITFDRSTIHCASNFLKEGVTEKLAVAMFTIWEND
tara:strand:- start:166 stop:1035 length:870 start_codon:yes stop_codon:yes gene_type:complete